MIPILIVLAVVIAAVALYRYDSKFHAWIDTKIAAGKATASKLASDAKAAEQVVASQAISLEKQLDAHLASKAVVPAPVPNAAA